MEEIPKSPANKKENGFSYALIAIGLLGLLMNMNEPSLGLNFGNGAEAAGASFVVLVMYVAPFIGVYRIYKNKS